MAQEIEIAETKTIQLPELALDLYDEPKAGFYGAYSLNGECVGFLTEDGGFLSLAKTYGLELKQDCSDCACDDSTPEVDSPVTE